MQLVLLCLGLCVLVMDLAAANYTFTYEMASRCKEHTCRHGYKYETYYLADASSRQAALREGVAFEMHLAVLAASNGHILLSSVPQPETGDPVYEIVVGGGGNKFTELRRNLRRNSKATAKTMGILSPIEYRAFYIRIGEDGLVEFGKEGNKTALLSFFDTDPIPIKYFSFTAWNGVEAKFLYDCPVAGENGSEFRPNSKEVDMKLSNSERLKKALLQDRPVGLAPGPAVPVKFGVKLTTVRYDPFETKLDAEFAAVASWTDESMAWNPAKFNGTTELKFSLGQIWIPQFSVFNSADIGMLEPRNADQITMLYSGEATLHFQAKTTTWCSYDEDTLNKWPRDKYECLIILERWNVHEILELEYLNPTSAKMKTFTAMDNFQENVWKVTGKQGVLDKEMSIYRNEMFNTNTTKSDMYFITLGLERHATTYNIVFYTPLLVLMTFLLLSFWTEPLKMSRVWFYAGTATLISMGLSYVDCLIPCHSVPSILVLYVCLLAGVSVALVLHICMMTPLVQPVYKSRPVQYLLTSKVFRMVFCLTALKTCNTYESINRGFVAQEDDDSGVLTTSRSNVEEMQYDNHSVGEREECAEVVDKLLFTVYSVLFAVLLAFHF
ncbi:5-hydroxytryptamine receptor 3A isoform X3 [Plutella xylostella]|uniref:5-hydroxytryptamine receptor 3A isoform X3 n=1 Tax=Plutella xylostella TaxID=51655 RepID=UPI002032FE60|nr:5-hydroxytryptamine receptor 3A isoform X3 [Plutella xylostella]